MSNQSYRRRPLRMAIVAAVALTAFSGGAQADPQPGTCKTVNEVAMAQSPAAAQQMWTAIVAGKFGPKWAHWVGAKNKAVVPVSNGYYQAYAKPCFYQPVL